MPELPEITLFRNYVTETSLNKTIKKIEFPDASLLQSPASKFQKELKGQQLKKAERLGKYLGISTSGNASLIFHFGMTGKLEYYANQDPPKYSKMIIHFEDDYRLAYTCRRKLGKIFLAEDLQKFQEENEIGKDALELSEKEFLELLEEKTGSIKGVLMDQHMMAGIGNVYSDEMLYQAGIHPKSKTNKISASEKKKLYKKLRSVLEMAIKKEGVRKEFPKSWLIQHREDGEDCPKCDGKVKQIKVSGRSTYFCPSCQKEEK
ncbi:Fpg/Nei family DNA glycosylase [Salinimicrobium terrae]|uniref:Fpg/Nei family DNA glycosylase n=1 Tax=Salinimicrobium terrae TaxID=470866 RepID=UPI000416A226|nr:DNA-formamidopyrimidine glycosylase family protein [Salinimicrobium terrae]